MIRTVCVIGWREKEIIPAAVALLVNILTCVSSSEILLCAFSAIIGCE